MAIVLVLLQISLCITLAMTQQLAPNNPGRIWLYQPTIIFNLESRNTLLPPRPTPGQNRLTAAFRDDYTYTPGIGSHKVHNESMTWNAARLTCKKEGGHLAIVNSEREAEIILQLMEKTELRSGYYNNRHPEYVYLGIHDLYKDLQYVTIHDESLKEAGYVNWGSGQPNGPPENCGTLYYDGTLHDFPCDRELAFVCELPNIKM